MKNYAYIGYYIKVLFFMLKGIYHGQEDKGVSCDIVLSCY